MGKRINGFMKRKVPVHIAVLVIGLFLMAGTLIAWTGSGTVDTIARTMYTRTLRALHSGQTIPYPLTIGTTTEPLTINATTMTVDVDSATIAGGVNFAPVNMITNQALAVWSGGTCSAAAATSIPDGWGLIDSTNTGVTRYDSSTVIGDQSSDVTGYNGYPHAVYVETVAAKGTSDYVTFPDDVETQQSWYQQFAGKPVTFGAWVWTDANTSGATDFIRAYICTSSTRGLVSMALSSHSDANGGWDWISATTTVPTAATGLEVGFEIDGTGYTGASAYITGPVLVQSTTIPRYKPINNEFIAFNKNLSPWSGSTIFGALSASSVGTTIDLSTHPKWDGIVPDDARSILAAAVGDFTTTGDTLHFYGDNIDSGVTLQATGSGISVFQTLVIPISSSGTIMVDNVAAVTGVSLYVQGATIR